MKRTFRILATGYTSDPQFSNLLLSFVISRHQLTSISPYIMSSSLHETSAAFPFFSKVGVDSDVPWEKTMDVLDLLGAVIDLVSHIP